MEQGARLKKEKEKKKRTDTFRGKRLGFLKCYMHTNIHIYTLVGICVCIYRFGDFVWLYICLFMHLQ